MPSVFGGYLHNSDISTLEFSPVYRYHIVTRWCANLEAAIACLYAITAPKRGLARVYAPAAQIQVLRKPLSIARQLLLCVSVAQDSVKTNFPDAIQ